MTRDDVIDILSNPPLGEIQGIFGRQWKGIDLQELHAMADAIMKFYKKDKRKKRVK